MWKRRWPSEDDAPVLRRKVGAMPGPMARAFSLARRLATTRGLAQNALEPTDFGGPRLDGKEAAVEVAGAGPAGLAAAITLARAGCRVVVHEAQRRVGHRFAPADLQGLENWTTDGDVLAAFQDEGLDTGFECRAFAQGLAFDAWDRAYLLASGSPLVYVVERGPGPRSLDSALLGQALGSHYVWPLVRCDKDEPPSRDRERERGADTQTGKQEKTST